MLIPVITFIVLFVLLSILMGAVSFHVFRFRYANDASMFVFISFAVIYLLTALLVFTLFNYQDNSEKNNNSQGGFPQSHINNQL